MVAVVLFGYLLLLFRGYCAQSPISYVFLTTGSVTLKSETYVADYSDLKSASSISFINSILFKISQGIQKSNLAVKDANVANIRNGSVIMDFYAIFGYGTNQMEAVNTEISQVVTATLANTQINYMATFYLYYGFATIVNLDPAKNETMFGNYILLSFAVGLAPKQQSIGIFLSNISPYGISIRANSSLAMVNFTVYTVIADAATVQSNISSFMLSEVNGTYLASLLMVRISLSDPITTTTTSSTAVPTTTSTITPALKSWEIALIITFAVLLAITVIVTISIVACRVTSAQN